MTRSWAIGRAVVVVAALLRGLALVCIWWRRRLLAVIVAGGLAAVCGHLGELAVGRLGGRGSARMCDA